jgi:hypothetical protein
MHHLLQSLRLIILTVLLCGIVEAFPIVPNPVVDGGQAAFILAGDSTTTKNGGWGDGFINMLKLPANGTNWARSGKTTVSFKAGNDGGLWGSVMVELKKLTSGKVTLFLDTDFSIVRRDSISDNKPAYFLLVGDSTTAPQVSGEKGNGGGWGNGFIQALQAPSGGANEGKNGATTVSYKKAYWEAIIARVKSNGSKKIVYVTIQVCHVYLYTSSTENLRFNHIRLRLFNWLRNLKLKVD